MGFFAAQICLQTLLQELQVNLPGFFFFFGCRLLTYLTIVGWVQGIFIAEHIMEHVAEYLGVSPDIIKQTNFYTKGQVTPYGEKLPFFNVPTLWSQIQTTAQYQERLAAVNQFNSSNRWTKKGISLVPIKFGVYWAGSPVR